MQEQLINASLTQKEADISRLTEENDVLNKRIRQNEGGVKTVFKDSDAKQLIAEFQEKINAKELASREEVQRYEDQISSLNLTIAQLKVEKSYD